jgi:hypothetical protein
VFFLDEFHDMTLLFSHVSRVWSLAICHGILESRYEYGFIGEIKRDDEGAMFLQTHAITNVALECFESAFYEENTDSGLIFRSLDCLLKAMTTEACHIQ